VPEVDWLLEKIQGFVDSGVLKGQYDRVWVNPDCGLKTRRWAEVIPSLKHMVEAAAVMRARLAAAGPDGAVGVTAGAGGAGVARAKAVGAVGGNGCVANGCCH
jgi:5-methyltetrahydropteroyltriglutamate--homocysteine methyltransferase